MRPSQFALAALVMLICSVGRADEVRLKCAADTNISSYPTEADFNYGRASRIRLKGIEMLGLFRFDLGPIKDWHVEKATLYLRYAGADQKLRTLGFSTVGAPWQEGTGGGERKDGECCFNWRALGKDRWAGRYTDFTDVTFTAGRTIAAYSDLTEVKDGWFSAPVDARIVQAMLAGASYGMAVSDEKGQTRANNDVYSREQSGSEPYLVVTGSRSQSDKAGAIADLAATPDPAHADLGSGALKLTFTAPQGAFGYALRLITATSDTGDLVPQYLLPFTKPGEKATITLPGLPPGQKATVLLAARSETGALGPTKNLSAAASPATPVPAPLVVPAAPLVVNVGAQAGPVRVWAYPDTEKAHPVSGNLLEEVGEAAYDGAEAGTYRATNPVWAGGRIRLSGARNEILGLQLLVECDSPRQGITVEPPSELRDTMAGRTIKPAISLFRDWYVKDGNWMPEVCVPLTGGFDIPAADNGVAGQRNQSVFVDLLVPRDAAPGDYAGIFTVRAPGTQPLRVPLGLHVNALTLPDTLSFDISLNTYGTMGHLFGIDDRTPEYRALEREYHRMAHLHRETLAILGYSHSGRITSNYAPPLAGEGADMRVVDWSAWDTQFGPYLDGSAFADLPRAGVPVTHIYLPLHEAWPSDIRKHYRYTPTIRDYPETIVEHAMKAPPIEQAMDSALSAEFKAVTRQMEEHFRQKGWNRTSFQFYQNDKHYYKDPKQGGEGTSWWLLDEPNHRDDWLALAYFGRLFRQAGEQDPNPRTPGSPNAPIVHREDISRPQWQRDYLDGLVDLMVVSGELYNKGPRLRQMQEQWPVRFWTYGSANPVKQSNVSQEAWAARAWLAGADGLVPWQTVGTDESYARPDETGLLLPGKRFGITGPIASIRLKALRRAQQDAEYLVLLAKANGWNREQVAFAVAPLLHLEGDFQQRDSEDAGRFQFKSLHAADFINLRSAIANALALSR